MSYHLTVGGTLNDGISTRSYDALNHKVTQDGTSYIYNADGVLISDGTTTYTQDLAAPLSQILSDGSATYVYGAGSERLRALDGPWYLGDTLGSVRTTLDDAGAVVATTSYDPWGTPQGELAGPFGFTGELHHGDQVYLRARWYTPGSGIFPTRDPFAGFPEMPYSLHAYQYAYSNPLIFTDPTGYMGHCALSLTTGPAAPVTGGLCVVASYAVAAVAGVTLGAIITCTGGIACEPHGGDPFPGPPVVPGPGPLPPDAQPRVLPDGPYLPQTFDPPALAPNPGPAPTPTPGAPPVVLPHAWDCPMPAPTMTPTPQGMSVFRPGNDTPQTTQHILDAIAAGKPSIVTYRGPGNGHKRGWLRTAPACHGRSQAQWCDEYPFASVDEGGQANNPSLRLVPSSEQRTQAGKWTGFLISCAVVAGEKVKIEPDLTLTETTWTCK